VADLGIAGEFWRDRRVLLTGHTGFKGSWLSLWLQSLGAQVFGFALPPATTPSLFDVARVGESMNHMIGDLRNLETLTACLSNAQPEFVFHLGAQSLVRLSYADPVGTFATNVMGTVHLLEAVRRFNQNCLTQGKPPTRAVIIVTSDKCYQNSGKSVPYREDEPLGGDDPYSSSKACAEVVTAAYRQSFGDAGKSMPAIASARAGNVIGGGDWAIDRLVPDAVMAFARDLPLRVRNPSAIRPWQHVLEPLAGYLVLAQALFREGERFAGAWNFGPDSTDEQPVSHVVSRLVDAWGKPARWEVDRAEHPHEAQVLKLDSSKARTHLAWRPRWNLDQAVKLTVEWYIAHGRASASMREQTLRHIRQYSDS
jgi:CDP-glucose 4,6-dehydratase